MATSQFGTGGDRDRSTVERLAAGVVGSEAVKHAAKRALEARERAVELQEFTLGALNLPSAAVIDRLTRRVRSVALRLEAIEDGLDRLEDRLENNAGGDAAGVEQVLTRLEAIEQRIEALAAKPAPAAAVKAPAARKPAAAKPAAAKAPVKKAPATAPAARKPAARKPAAPSSGTSTAD